MLTTFEVTGSLSRFSVLESTRSVYDIREQWQTLLFPEIVFLYSLVSINQQYLGLIPVEANAVAVSCCDLGDPFRKVYDMLHISLTGCMQRKAQRQHAIVDRHRLNRPEESLADIRHLVCWVPAVLIWMCENTCYT